MRSTNVTASDFAAAHPDASVVCSIRDPDLTDVAVRAVVAAGGVPRPTPWKELVSQAEASHCSALVYDLAPYDRRSCDIITATRDRCPWMSILLYVEPTAPAFAAFQFVHDLANVRILLQNAASNDNADFVEQLHTFVDELPLKQAIGLIADLIPDKTPIVRSYIRSALRALEYGESVRVHTALGGSESTVRTLQRSLKLQQLPNPKEMLDWATLIYAAFLSNRVEMPVSRIARYLGLSSHDLYRLRCRLAPKAGGVQLSRRRPVLASVVRAFATRCGISEGGVHEACGRLLGAATSATAYNPLTR